MDIFKENSTRLYSSSFNFNLHIRITRSWNKIPFDKNGRLKKNHTKLFHLTYVSHLMNGLSRDGSKKDRNVTTIYALIILHLRTSQSSRNVDDDLETPLFRWMRPLEKFDSRGSRREIIPPYFSTLPFSIPEGAERMKFV